jgi:hypothetical protein
MPSNGSSQPVATRFRGSHPRPADTAAGRSVGHGEVHGQRGGEQADRQAQPELGQDHVVGELADAERGAGWAEPEQQGDVLPEVLMDVEVPAQRLLGAEHGQDVTEVEQGGEGEAVPVPALLHQDQQLPDQPHGQAQRREPEQQDHR